MKQFISVNETTRLLQHNLPLTDDRQKISSHGQFFTRKVFRVATDVRYLFERWKNKRVWVKKCSP